MMNEMIVATGNTAVEYISGLGLDAAKNHVKDKIDEKNLIKALSEYIKSQEKYNEISSLDEEIDFQGLIEYIRKNLISKVTVSLFEPDQEKRERAKHAIIADAIEHSKAENENAKKRVASNINMCLDIIYHYYESGISFEDYTQMSIIFLRPEKFGITGLFGLFVV